jgi:hypothetical protein
MAAFISFQPTDFFNSVLYTGNQPSSNAITGVGFSPNFVWVKNRDATQNHVLFNTSQGLGQSLYGNLVNSAVTDANGITAFGADGFTVADWSEPNNSGDDYISWNWKAGTSSGIATDGSTTITPSDYSFNQTSGFSVLKYTGTGSAAKMAHGLGATPTMFFLKNLGTSNDWVTYNKYVKATDPEDWVMRTNNTSAAVDDAAMWNDTQPDDVNISFGSSANTNASANTYVMYCFAPIQGHSIFGRYMGNASVNGPFLQTNFRPRFVILKRLDGTTGWVMITNPTNTENLDADNPMYYMNENNPEGTVSYVKVEFLSNGFKFRDSAATVNTNGGHFVYWAFAEFPFVSSNSIPGDAR